MPTGYTATLYNGKPQTFNEFVMECARAFGALISLRDEPNKPIPEEFTPSTSYYDKTLASAELTLRRVKDMTEAEAGDAATEEWREAIARHLKRERERLELHDRYTAMLRQVDAWQPPTSEHDGLKRFMHEQLTEAIRFDCSSGLSAPVRLTAGEWKQAQIDRAQRDIEYAEKGRAEEIERARSRSEWVRQLRSSLSSPSVAS